MMPFRRPDVPGLIAARLSACGGEAGPDAGWPHVGGAGARVLDGLWLAAELGDGLAAEAAAALLRWLAHDAAAAWIARALGPARLWLQPALAQLPGVARAALDPGDLGAGCWRPALPEEAARGVVVLPVLGARAALGLGDAAGDYVPVDLLALDPARPELVWRRTGLADWLGCPPEDGAIALRAQPLDWLRAGGAASGAVCPLDLDAVIWAWGESREMVFAAGEEALAETYHARRQALLRPKRPALPRILIAERAAA